MAIAKILKDMRSADEARKKSLQEQLEGELQASLSLEDTSLIDDDIVNLAEVLKINKTVTHLCIKDIKIGTKSLRGPNAYF